MDVSELLPSDGGLVVREVVVDADAIRLTVESNALTANCPGCRASSGRVHGLYLRTAADLPRERAAHLAAARATAAIGDQPGDAGPYRGTSSMNGSRGSTPSSAPPQPGRAAGGASTCSS
jgi:hypothetical protein